MKTRRSFICGSLVGMMVYTTVLLAGDLKSGPQPGEGVTPFDPLNIFNADSPSRNGKEACFIWQLGSKPVALVFARETDDALASLVKKLDAEVAKNGKAKVSAVVIFLAAGDDMKSKIEDFKKAHNVKHVSLALDGPKGPEDYKIAKEASVTAIIYKGKKVKSNQAFEKFATNDVETVINNLSKVVAPETEKK